MAGATVVNDSNKNSYSLIVILRIILSIGIVSFSIIVNGLLDNLEKQKKCPCNSGWKIINGKLISLILIIIAGVNIFMPANKFLSTLPIIGSTYVLFFILILFMIMFIINRISKELETPECSKCKTDKYQAFLDFFGNKTIMEFVYISIIITIIFFYV